MPAIALGTVQFGLDYGLTNSSGQLSDREAQRILQVAQEAGIVWLDTAAAYGNAEERLGQLLGGDKHFSLCSKTLPTPQGQSVLASAQRSLDLSLTRLRRDHVDALLIHAVGDLLGAEGDRLWQWMASARQQGMAHSIGVSVYDEAEIDAVLERASPDWIQLPCSVLDQRLVTTGVLERLAVRGIRLQARSLLLQGVVNVAPDKLPQPLMALHEPLSKLRRAADQHGVSAIDMALAWAAAQPIELAVLGVTTADELLQCVEAFQRRVELDWSAFACDDPAALDPRKWPKGMRPA
ncbi:aldo/keto reductase [Uliginosibacterium sp. H3]|uniref:Aldo/keto reductase n=1 Tax=Uliginosibacterium silvisoli TaxID=3114758 RepID=A0ABU6K967_9RHOO|nr:aldo/keto reductase [Uliginosibacterium sp. H3]